MTQRRRNIEAAICFVAILLFIAALCAVSAFQHHDLCKTDARYTDAGTQHCFKK